jgi:bacterioferritin (cytochrome b1)
MGTTAVDSGPPSDFTERLVDGFFRRWVLYILPVAMFVAIGVYAAGNITADYGSYARLSATSNPYLEQPTIRGTEIAFYESPADGTARLINEQLRTDAFIDDVASRADLTEAIAAGVITRVDIRNQLGASGAGQNTLQVNARWSDPETAFRLVDGTIQGYREYLARLAAADSLEAVEFWTEQKDEATEEVQAAEDALAAYIAQLPPDPENQSRPTEQVLEIQRLNASVDRALEAERDAQNTIDEARLTANQAASTSTRQLSVIDAPEIATAPEPVRRDKITAIAMFTLLGVLIALAALVLSTVADRAVRTRSQLAHTAGIGSVVVVPRIKQLRRARRRPVSASGEAA